MGGDKPEEANETLEQQEERVAESIEDAVNVPASIEEEMMLEAAELEELRHPRQSPGGTADEPGRDEDSETDSE